MNQKLDEQLDNLIFLNLCLKSFYVNSRETYEDLVGKKIHNINKIFDETNNESKEKYSKTLKSLDDNSEESKNKKLMVLSYIYNVNEDNFYKKYNYLINDFPKYFESEKSTYPEVIKLIGPQILFTLCECFKLFGNIISQKDEEYRKMYEKKNQEINNIKDYFNIKEERLKKEKESLEEEVKIKYKNEEALLIANNELRERIEINLENTKILEKITNNYSLEIEYENLKGKLSNKIKEYDNLKKNNEKLKSLNNKMSQNWDNYNNIIEDYKKQIINLKTKNMELSIDLQKKEIETQNLKDKITNLKIISKEKENELRDECEDEKLKLKKEYDEFHRTEINELNKRITLLEKTIEKINLNKVREDVEMENKFNNKLKDLKESLTNGFMSEINKLKSLHEEEKLELEKQIKDLQKK